MYISPKCWLIIYFAVIPAFALAKANSPTEVAAYALVEGYKVPFKIKTEADASRHVQNVHLTLDMDQIPTIKLEGPIDSRINYRSELSRLSLCGADDKRICLNVQSHVELNTLIPASGNMTFTCYFDIANQAGKLSVDKVDLTDMQIDPWLMGLASFMGREKDVASRIKGEIEKQLQSGEARSERHRPALRSQRRNP